MGYVLHDRHGYVCDLASAYGCSKLIAWLAGVPHGPASSGFVADLWTTHPRKLAAELDTLLVSRPPTDPDVAEVARALVAGLRRSRGCAELVQ